MMIIYVVQGRALPCGVNGGIECTMMMMVVVAMHGICIALACTYTKPVKIVAPLKGEGPLRLLP